MFHPEHSDVFGPPDQPSIPRGHPWIAWGVIAAVATWIAVQRSRVEIPPNQTARLQSVVGDWQARYLAGAAKMFPQKETEWLAAAPVDRGPIEQRLRNLVLVGELQGPRGAAEKLEDIEDSLREKDARQEDREAVNSLARLYDDAAQGKTTLPSISPADRQRLVERLGWTGRLALHPADTPDRQERDELLKEAHGTVVRAIACFGIGLLMILAGVVALATIVLLLLVRPSSRALPPATQHGGIYAETFAVWIVGYVALSYLTRLLPIERNQILLSGAVMLLSLAALGWPVMRGIPWRTVRQEVGLHLGRKPFVELLLGPVAYLAAIPLAIVGVVIFLALFALTHSLFNAEGGELSSGRIPYHPAVDWLLAGNGWAKVEVVFLASVMAPLMEETLFRGVLYRHLRDATGRLRYVGSVLASGLTTSFVFAAIHPQGLIAVPPLMGLALGFTLAREWRGTLLPAMMAHGLNNGLVTCTLISMGSG
ncbi:MAG TPA: type II CAAX endopeptidase family protein [Pirellulales bacterium]|nr:type II CAAX endopeptidase family protein [Pirellulales bacterium]